jgi:hypothetical protein
MGKEPQRILPLRTAENGGKSVMKFKATSQRPLLRRNTSFQASTPDKTTTTTTLTTNAICQQSIKVVVKMNATRPPIKYSDFEKVSEMNPAAICDADEAGGLLPRATGAFGPVHVHQVHRRHPGLRIFPCRPCSP